MKMYLTLLILLIGLTCVHSQELKTVTKKNSNTSEVERYTVLKSNKKIKHGAYQKSRGDKMIEKGYFSNNMKDSMWVKFYSYKPDTASVGYYKENKPVGQWTFYQGNGIVCYRYDYSTAELIEYKWLDTPNKFQVLINNRWIESEIDNPPLLIGLTDPRDLIVTKMVYPARAAEKGVSGKVQVAFIVDSLGRMSDLRINKSADVDLDAEAIRVTKLLGNEWFPAKKDGKPVTVDYFMYLNFVLQ